MRAELAEHGFRFCTQSLEAKLKKQEETPVEEQTGEPRSPAQQQPTAGDWLSW